MPHKSQQPYLTNPPAPTNTPTATNTNTGASTRSLQPESHTCKNIVNSASTYQPPDPFILINDGTQCLTIRWIPEDYNHLAADSTSWDTTLTTILQHMFHVHNSRTAIVKWEEQHTLKNNSLLGEITHDKIRSFLSPNISHLKTKKIIFGLQVCAPDNHLNVWITRASTQEILRNYKMEITLSN
jgi:hypothetical protein